MTSVPCAAWGSTRVESVSPAVELEPAYLLHRRPYRETSLLLEALTREQGRVGLVARGGRGPHSRRRALLQPFQPLLLSWSGRGELGTLRTAEPAGPSFALTGDALFAGFYANELLLRCLQRQDPSPEIFDDYPRLLAGLAEGRIEASLRGFEKRLLEALGYGLLLTHDVSGAPLDPDGHYRYELEQGPVSVTADAAGNLVFRGASLLALAGEHLPDAEALADAKRLLRACLALYLGDRPMKTREVLADMRARL